MQHVTTECMSNVQECEEVWQEWHRAMCAKCVELKEEKQLIKLKCVYEFAYLGDMLNDTGGMEQAVATRVKAAWMRFRELGGVLCM